MAIAKRVALFLIVNIFMVAVISFILYFFNLQPFLTKYGLNYGSLALFCLIWGMGGAFISLGLSRVMAKWLMGVKVIDPNTHDSDSRQVLETVYRLAKKAGLPAMPEVGIPFSGIECLCNRPLKIPCSGRCFLRIAAKNARTRSRRGFGHEITHIANGDMVTMTLLQGIINAFVMFFARIIAFAISRTVARSRDSEGFSPLMYQLTVFAFEMVFMILGSLVIARFSRFREFRADAGGARLAGPQNMISALQALKRNQEIANTVRQQQPVPAIQALKISSQSGGCDATFCHSPSA